jgi:hypothetical protein
VVLTEDQSNETYKGNNSQLPWNSRFIDVDEPCYQYQVRHGYMQQGTADAPLSRPRFIAEISMTISVGWLWLRGRAERLVFARSPPQGRRSAGARSWLSPLAFHSGSQAA